MFFKKEGLPEESELVMCTISKIHYSSVFANLDDYQKSGMIHISEIAAGRIRNISDYVKENKKVVCKVLKIDTERGHIDLSLRRVTDSQRRKTVNALKLEQKAESIISYIAKQHKIDDKKLYDSIIPKIFKEYDYLHHLFEDVVSGEAELSNYFDKKYVEQLDKLIELRFKPRSIEITGVLKLSSYEGNGLEIVQKSLDQALSDDVDIKYLGGGKYKVTVAAADYKEAEKIMKEAVDKSLKYMLDNKGLAEFTRK